MNPRSPATPQNLHVQSCIAFMQRWRYLVIALGFGLIALAAVQAMRLHKDTSADAFLDPANPALQYRRQVAEVFGLKDPVVIAIRNDALNGILNPQSLQRVRELSEALGTVPNVDPDRIVSIATENYIGASAEGMVVAPLLPEGDIDAGQVASLARALDDMPLYEGVLVSRDRTSALIVAELVDERHSSSTYEAIAMLARELTAGSQDEVFVSGEGAVSGYLSTYVDNDARRMLPIAALVILALLFAAFLTVRSVLIPLAVVVATVVVTLGAMAAGGTAYFAITGGMVVALIGIAVADSIHVFSEYYTQMRERPQASGPELVMSVMTQLWTPIWLTSLTTGVGFAVLFVTSTMPPIRYFGLFGAVGVAVAWLYTVTLVPALLSCLPARQSRLFSKSSGDDTARRAALWVGRRVIAHPRTVLVGALVLSCVGVMGMSQLRMDYERIGNFNRNDPLRLADESINRSFDGTYHIDIVVESSSDEGLLQPDALRRIEALQAELESLDQVGTTRSIVDYIKQMHRSLSDGDPLAYRIPDDASLIAQLFLVYQASAEPTALERNIDSSYRTALIRAYLPVGRWSEQHEVVDVVERHLAANFNGPDLKATATGRVVVDDVWMQGIADSHLFSVVATLAATFILCGLLFRSLKFGLLALVPNIFAVFWVYSIMGFADIWLGVATSIFASIAIGIGVDFAIHTLQRLREASEHTQDIDARILYIYQSTGRALLLNTLTVGLGFGVILFSSVPPIRLFGGLVATAILAAYLASLLVIPALLKLLAERRRSQAVVPAAMPAPGSAMLAIVLCAGVLLASDASADSTAQPSAQQVMQHIADRPEGATSQRTVQIQLIDRHGVVREQVTRAFRKNVDAERRTVLFYESPASVRGTAFLTYDYAAANTADDQWLYLPALRKVRRVPAAERGDNFLGTDLSYEEIRNDNRITLTDWNVRLDGREAIDGVECIVVEGQVSSPQVGKELGLSRARWHVDPKLWISRRAEFWDKAGNRLKTVENRELRQVDGIWTPARIEAANHKTGHRTVLVMSDVRFGQPIDDQMFTQQQLLRGR